VGDAEPNGPARVVGAPFPTAHEGHGGFTIDTGTGPAARPGLAPLVSGSIRRHRPHVVTLMIGTNDVALGVDHLASRLAKLVDEIITPQPAIVVMLAQIIPTSSASHNARVRAYNLVVADVARSRAEAGHDVRLVDAYTPMADAPGFPDSVLADDLHPNDAGYAILAQAWYEALRPLLLIPH
jgi:lysophospholipase L1-like esterase